MKKYKYDFVIEAASDSDADMKMGALKVLASRLKPHELAKLAHVVKNDPVKTAFAKSALGL